MTILLLLDLLAAPGPVRAPDDLRPLPSWHALESSQHSGDALPIEPAGADLGRSPSATVFGFLPYWVSAPYLQYDLISVLACFSIDMGASGTITSWHGFPSAFSGPIDGIHSAGGLAVVTVVNFSGSQIHSILTTGRATAISTLQGVLTSTAVDGICIDFEGVQAADRDDLTSFMQVLRDSLESVEPGCHLSICTPAVDWSGAFDYPGLAGACDALMMMCYPFHGSWSTEAGPCCPLTGWGSSPSSASNMAWTIGDYIINDPDIHSKLVVGLPYYGFEWETADQYAHSEAIGDCLTLYYSSLALRAAQYGRLWDGESLTPWYAYDDGTWNQGWYDDPVSLGLKYSLVLDSGIQGIGVWALGYDGSRPELWECLDQFFASPWPEDDVTDNLEHLCTLGGPSQYWHYWGEGYMYSHFYTGTISSGPDVNSATWSFDLPDQSGSYCFEAWIPDGCDALAAYLIESPDGTDTVVVDQSAWAGSWAPLGGPFPASPDLHVYVGDCTGITGQTLGVDAIRFVEQTGAPGGGQGGRPTLAVGSNPAPVFEISTEPLGPGRLLVFDLHGRLLFERDLEPGVGTMTEWPEGSTPSGIYFAVLLDECAPAATGELVLLH
jgi:hypothetical protein